MTLRVKTVKILSLEIRTLCSLPVFILTFILFTPIVSLCYMLELLHK